MLARKLGVPRFAIQLGTGGGEAVHRRLTTFSVLPMKRSACNPPEMRLCNLKTPCREVAGSSCDYGGLVGLGRRFLRALDRSRWASGPGASSVTTGNYGD